MLRRGIVSLQISPQKSGTHRLRAVSGAFLKNLLSVTGSTYQAHDAVLSRATIKLNGIKQVAHFGAVVLHASRLVYMVIHVGEIDRGLRREIRRQTRHPNNANAVLGRRLGRLLQDRGQEVHKQEMAQHVGPLLQFVTLNGLGALGWRHDAGVVPDHIETRLGSEELVGGGFDGGQVVEDQLEEEEAAAGFGELDLDLRNGVLDGFLVARGDVNARVVLVEDFGEFLANAAGAAGHDEDLNCQAACSSLHGMAREGGNLPCRFGRAGFPL